MKRSLSLIRPWQQQRSAATVQRIAQATMRLLVGKDFDAISVDEIVRLARTSKGSFYFRFATKAHLLRYLAEETFTALNAESRQFFEHHAASRSSLREFVDKFIAVAAGVYIGRRNLLRAFSLEARPGGDEVVIALVRAGSREAARQLTEALLSRKKSIKHAQPEIAICMAAMTLGVALRHAFLFPEQVPPALQTKAREPLSRELREMVLGYLKAS